jgi:hypothetical protein
MGEKRREAILRGFGFTPYASLLKGREWKEYLKNKHAFFMPIRRPAVQPIIRLKKGMEADLRLRPM